MAKVTLKPAPARPHVVLPPPDTDGGRPLAAVLAARRSVRDFDPGRTLSLDQLGQLLWAAQGVTSRRGFRTAPSAGGLLPLELDVLAGRIDGLPVGLYRFDPTAHSLRRRRPEDRRAELASLCAHQDWIGNAPLVVSVNAVPERTAQKYGRAAERYIHMEAGHAAQNMLLQAVSLGLGACPVGAVPTRPVKDLLALAEDELPVYVVAVGQAPETR